ncbi:kinase-like domain-containing protein [Rhizophagus irregularis DAOM 181602=DAOM 197198]|nr:kinase-like domain-containing protein [Rhizophagus irregularis DAOM 181602=DAOM 197198]
MHIYLKRNQCPQSHYKDLVCGPFTTYDCEFYSTKLLLKGNTLGLAGTRELDHEIDIGEIKKVHRVLLKDTPKENVKFIDGRIQRAGEFRSEVYQFEVPALTEKFIQFRNECTKNPGVHHLIITCHILSASLHIHPFINDNGRLGRSIMALYFIRNGYPPVVFQKIQRLEYALALFQSQTMKEPAPLYTLEDMIIIDILSKCHLLLATEIIEIMECLVNGTEIERNIVLAVAVRAIILQYPMWEIHLDTPPFTNHEHDYNLAINIIDGIRPEIVSGTPLEYKNLMKKRWDA